MKRGLVALAAFALVFAGTPVRAGDEVPGGHAPLDVPEVALYDAPTLESAMLGELNLERRKNRLPSLAEDAQLTAVARAYAREMLREGFIGHVTPEGTTIGQRLHAAGLTFVIAGENLAFTTGDESEAFAHLLASPGHHANMLNRRFTRVGIGAVAVSAYATMFVQEFAGD
jgi:uncharacterized protein YkwD